MPAFLHWLGSRVIKPNLFFLDGFLMTQSDSDSSSSKSNWDLPGIVSSLRSVREQWRTTVGRNREYGFRELPSKAVIQSVVDALCGALFPMRLGPPELREEGEDFYVGHTLETALNQLLTQAELELAYQRRHGGDDSTDDIRGQAREMIRLFAAGLPTTRALLDSDVMAAYRGDPAARTVDEILLCYPGITAMIHHRLAHSLYQLGLPLLARVVSELAHSDTGIDIHPGATIGHSFFIDHGTGVVIGETAIIGNNVRLYQAVTLGAKSFPAKDDGSLQKGLARHPIVEDDVVIYAGATVLGRVTIGKASVIGGNVWLTRDVPPGSVVTQAGFQDKAY